MYSSLKWFALGGFFFSSYIQFVTIVSYLFKLYTVIGGVIFWVFICVCVWIWPVRFFRHLWLWCSNFSTHQNHLEAFIKHRLTDAHPELMSQGVWSGAQESASSKVILMPPIWGPNFENCCYSCLLFKSIFKI